MTPNQVTSIRIALLPLIAFFYLATFIPWGKFIAVVLFAVAALTDFVDGRLARKTGQVTDLGKFLDTIADKLLVTVALLLIIADPTVTFAPYLVIAGIIILCREFAVTFLRQIAVNKGKVIAADKFGKYKALFQDIMLPAFMLYGFFMTSLSISATFNTVWRIICYVLLGVTVVMTILSGINYFVKNWSVFKEDKHIDKF